MAWRRRTPIAWDDDDYSLAVAWETFEFPPGIEPGGIPRRLVARFIDVLLVALVPLSVVLLGDRLPGDQLQNALWGTAIAWEVYEPGLLWLRGATVGKLTMGITVVRMDDLHPPSFLQAELRWLCIVMFVAGFVRFLLTGMTTRSDDPARQRGLPDRVAGTIVVRRPRATA